MTVRCFVFFVSSVVRMAGVTATMAARVLLQLELHVEPVLRGTHKAGHACPFRELG